MTDWWAEARTAVADLLFDTPGEFARPAGTGPGTFNPSTYDVNSLPATVYWTGVVSISPAPSAGQDDAGDTYGLLDKREVKLSTTAPEIKVGDVFTSTGKTGAPQTAGTWTVDQVMGASHELTRRVVVSRPVRKAAGA